MIKHEIKEGEVYGHLTVLCEEYKVYENGRKERAAKCKCVCGKITIVNIIHLMNGRSKSCGCKIDYVLAGTTHGLSKHPLYEVWEALMARTKDNPKSKYYKNYYGKGVRVCPEWKDPKVFYDWALANGWKKGLQLDKDIIPFKLGIPALLYSPEMCCFVTTLENSNTRIDSDYIEFDGEKITVTQLARKIGMSKGTLYNRIHVLKMPVEKAILKTHLGYNKSHIKL